MAIEDFNKAIRLKPDNADAYNNRGTIYTKFGQYQMAIEDFNNAIRLKPDDANTYINKGLVYFNQGKNISGCEDAKKPVNWEIAKYWKLLKQRTLPLIKALAAASEGVFHCFEFKNQLL